MTGTEQLRPTQQQDRGSPWLGRAWTAVALVPVAFILAMAVGEGLYAAFGYDPGMDDPPLWADLVSGLPALAIVLAPCVAAVVYGRRARRGGDGRGLFPLLVGGAVGLLFTVLTVGSLLGV